MIAYIVFYGSPPLTVLLLPLVLFPLMLFTSGIVWIISALGVFLRDITQITNMLMAVLMFLSPIFLPHFSVAKRNIAVF
jgi:lipopolysaccharide transport system permease protein